MLGALGVGGGSALVLKALVVGILAKYFDNLEKKIPKVLFTNVFLKVCRTTSQLVQSQFLMENIGDPIKVKDPRGPG